MLFFSYSTYIYSVCLMKKSLHLFLHLALKPQKSILRACECVCVMTYKKTLCSMLKATILIEEKWMNTMTYKKLSAQNDLRNSAPPTNYKNIFNLCEKTDGRGALGSNPWCPCADQTRGQKSKEKKNSRWHLQTRKECDPNIPLLLLWSTIELAN